MIKAEIDTLIGLARQTDHCIVEVGTQYGHTCLELARAFPNRHIITIDNSKAPTMCDGQMEEKLPIREIGHLVRGLPNVLQADCDSAHFLCGTLKIGMVLIDGDHSYAGVKRDTEHWMQYFRTHSSGGMPRFIAWHDAHEDRPAWIGVLEYLTKEITPRPWKRVDGTLLAYLKV